MLDQATKGWIERALSDGAQIAGVAPFFYLTRVGNPGGSFGLFAASPLAVRRVLLVGLPVLVVAVTVLLHRRLAPRKGLAALALGMIVGGTIGNLVDRVARGAVVDFLRFYLWRGYAWPDFNLADVAIVVGLGLLALGSGRTPESTRPR